MSRTKSKTVNMTEGSPFRLILEFCLPMLGGLVFQQLYTVIDSAIVGRLLGSAALGAVGSTGYICFLVFGFSTGTCSGFAIPISQYFGAGDEDNMKKCVGTSIWIAALITILFTVPTVIFCRPILTLLQTPADILDMAYDYLVVIFAGIPATILYNLLGGYLRALGNSRVPMIFVIASSLLNIVLDIVFILVFKSGVMGAALATVIAQLAAGIGSLIYVVKRFEPLHVNRRQLKPDRKIAGRLLWAGLPMGLQFSITAIGGMILQVFINQLGTTAVSAISAGNRPSSFLGCPIDALASAVATYCGQNVGAGRLDRLKKGILSAFGMGSVYSVVLLVVLIFFGRLICMIFVDPSETEVLDLAAEYLILTTAFYIPLVAVNVFRLAIQGMGYASLALIAGVMELFGRGLAGMLLVPRFGYIGACLGQPLAWLFADLFLVPACFIIINLLKKKMKGKGSGLREKK